MPRARPWVKEFIESATGSPETCTDVIWPTVSEIEDSTEGTIMGGSIPGRSGTIDALRRIPSIRFCRWSSAHNSSSDGPRRNRDVAHLKSYCRSTPDGKELDYVILGSTIFRWQPGELYRKIKRSFIYDRMSSAF